MKNNHIISFLFGLIVLFALHVQIIDSLQFIDVSENQIELSEKNFDSEKEKFEELKWIEGNPLSFFKTTIAVSKKTIQASFSYNKFYIKIPSPPPELT
ncbi:MAG: hypothetical protein MK105_03845 [Crocinitomicaceae bacterium]|nr:hypothetical protein [Crocinitomicaceae bacterium]